MCGSLLKVNLQVPISSMLKKAPPIFKENLQISLFLTNTLKLEEFIRKSLKAQKKARQPPYARTMQNFIISTIKKKGTTIVFGGWKDYI
jgi:hypothetical protein